ncbi:hypothetical protein INR49_026591 [Caranx melampygus]|nr:hypothetical protein INR49_026591 [Caranx melampygus]
MSGEAGEQGDDWCGSAICTDGNVTSEVAGRGETKSVANDLSAASSSFCVAPPPNKRGIGLEGFRTRLSNLVTVAAAARFDPQCQRLLYLFDHFEIFRHSSEKAAPSSPVFMFLGNKKKQQPQTSQDQFYFLSKSHSKWNKLYFQYLASSEADHEEHLKAAFLPRDKQESLSPLHISLPLSFDVSCSV